MLRGVLSLCVRLQIEALMEKHQQEDRSDDEVTLVMQGGRDQDDDVVDSPNKVDGFEKAAKDVLKEPPMPLPAPGSSGVNILQM